MTKEMLKAERERKVRLNMAISSIRALRTGSRTFVDREAAMRNTIRNLMVGSHKGRIGGCKHKWEYYEEPDPTIKFTGFLERCKHCGMIVQVPQ